MAKRLQTTVPLGGRGSKIYYAVCTTADYVNPKQAKTVTGDFVLEVGARVGVKFIYGNIGAQWLNVDGTGEYKMVSASTGEDDYNQETPVMYKPIGQIIWFTFDGFYWVVDDSVRATEDTVGAVHLTHSIDSTSKTAAASGYAMGLLNAKMDAALAAYITDIDALVGGDA